MKKKMTMALSLLLAMTLITGCGAAPAQETQGDVPVVAPENLTAEDVYQAMCKAVDGRMATSFTSRTEAGAKISAMMMNMEAEMTATTQVKLSREPFAVHSSTALEATFAGMDLNKNVVIYSAAGDEGLTSYLHLGEEDTWYRHQTTLVPTDLLGQYQVTACTADWVPQGLTLSQAGDDYLLSCTYDADTLLTALTSPFGELSLRDLDVSNLSLQVSYRVDGTTFLPEEITIEYRGMSAVIADLVSKYAGELMGGKISKLEADVQSYRETLSGLTYEPVEVPQAPQSALENSKDVSDFNFWNLLKKS